MASASTTSFDAPLLVLDLGLNIIDGVRGLDLERDGLASQSLNEDLPAQDGQRRRRRAQTGGW